MEKLTKKEIILLTAVLLAGLAGLFFSFNFNSLAFPQSKINFEITSSQAEDKAIDFIQQLGFKPQDYKRTTIFFSQEEAQDFLEKELGAAKAGELMNDQINVWNFETRFFKPSEQEEFFVDFDNLGRLAGFFRELPEDRAGGKLSKDEARQIAEGFIASKTHFKLNDFSLAEDDYVQRPDRLDYHFTWEKNNYQVNEATYRLIVDVSGSEVTFFNQYLKIPESWQRQEADKYSYNDTAQFVATIFFVVLIIIPIFIFLFKKFKVRQLNYRLALKVSLFVSFVSLLSVLNLLRLQIFSYNTLDSWPKFWASLIFMSLADIVINGLYIFIIVVSAEALWRELFPSDMALPHLLKKVFFRNKSIFKSVAIGFSAGLVVLAYQIIYYFLGRKINFWVPAETNYDNIFSTYWPWLYALTMGLVPAIEEEVLFRLFGISFLKKIIKKTWLAVIITSAIWSFLHSGYPQQPFYARGLELLPVGILFGWLFLRFGLLTSITAHFTLNATLTAQFLIKSDVWATKIGSCVIFLLPLIAIIISLIWYFRKKGFNIPSNLDNSYLTGELANKKSEERQRPPLALGKYEPLPKKNIILLVILVIAGILSSVAVGIWIGDDYQDLKPPEFKFNNYQISKIADSVLSNKKINPKEYFKVVLAGDYFSQDETDYILEKGGLKDLQTIYDKKIPAFVWQVRYFQPQEKEEYHVSLLPNSQIYDFTHLVVDEALGEKLDYEQAQAIAENYLTEEKKYKIEDFNLVDKQQYKEANRTDYSLVYEQKDYRIGESTYRTRVDISGDKVNGFSQYLKIPESWLRQKEEAGLKDFIIGALFFVVSLAIVILAFVNFLIFYRRKMLPFKESFKIILVLAIPYLLLQLNSLALLYDSYQTTESLSLYYFKEIIFLLLGLAAFIFFGWLALGYFLALWHENISANLLPENLTIRKKMLVESLYISYGLIFFLMGLTVFLLYVVSPFFAKLGIVSQTTESVLLLSLPSGLNHFLPALTVFSESVLSIFALVILAIVTLLLFRYLRRWWAVMLFFILMLSASLVLEDNWQEIAFSFGSLIFAIMLLYFLYHWFFRKNFLSVLVLFYTLMVFVDATDLWQPNNFLRLNCLVSFGFLAMPIIIVLVLVARYKKVDKLLVNPTDIDKKL